MKKLTKYFLHKFHFNLIDSRINTDEEGVVYAGVVDQVLDGIEDFGGKLRLMILPDKVEDLGAASPFLNVACYRYSSALSVT